jgi:3-dehydroquinate dehydratase/shikimate dehydrogenase
VIGAGGASRAVVHALVSSGARVLVLNRTAPKAELLAREFKVLSASLESGFKLMEGYNDLIVQATKVGMSPQEDADPLPAYQFTGRETVFDLVYVPQTTVFLQRALAAGCRVITGEQMLLAQAFEQFRFFTGSDYPEAAKMGLSQFTRPD